MGRYVIVFMLITVAAVVQATPQFTESQCQMLNAQRLEVRRQLRQPYNAEHGQQLQARQKELERLLKQHCKQPVKDPPAATVLAAAQAQQPLTAQPLQRLH